MLKKVLVLALDAVVSLVMFLILAILIDLIASKLFGTTVGADGTHTVNMNGGVLLAITSVLTVVFAVWFYRLMTNYKFSKV